MQKKAVLACSQCGKRNYSTSASKDGTRLEFKKFCSTCSTHTVHRETK
ncbi:50S ribosomal protein L33 [Cytobacillus gottheilii]|nr:50S ribosomal protein L33 [Cytobacillus gottheilii]